MGKSFGEWMGSMANSIEDLSTVVAENRTTPLKKLTDIQKRIMIADLVVANVSSESDVELWMCVFRVSAMKYPNGAKELTRILLTDVIDKKSASEYYTTDNTVQWLEEFKIKHNVRNI